MDHTIQKYAEERKKRLRSDGTKQYKNLQAEQPEDYLQDPFVDYEKIRAQEPPLRHGDNIKFLIVGAGHNGLLFAYRLMEMGFKSNEICVVDSAGGFGGTWYWNRYPGAMCDVEASIYLPLLEETSYIPKHRYSFGYEIRENAERIAAHLDLRALFCTKVHSQVWNEAEGAWTISMKRNLGPGFDGENLTVQARFVFGAWGYFYSPRIPELPGLDILKTRRNTFHTFHTSRWDYAYTGGSQEHPALVNLKDKKVSA
jgi:cation diffusion facilitator CzcD-associated flavoprotein CzcO